MYSVHVLPSQVHACNILRALYRETKLGEGVFPFVSDGVVVAINGFHSDSWAVSRLHLCNVITYCYIFSLKPEDSYLLTIPN